MLRHNTHQQRQAILGLITSPHNNSSRTLLSPKLQLHMGTHTAPLPHASDPQNHKTLPPSPYPTKQITPTPTPTTSPKPVEPAPGPCLAPGWATIAVAAIDRHRMNTVHVFP